jgi:hypothetical protein
MEQTFRDYLLDPYARVNLPKNKDSLSLDAGIVPKRLFGTTLSRVIVQKAEEFNTIKICVR